MLWSVPDQGLERGSVGADPFIPRAQANALRSLKSHRSIIDCPTASGTSPNRTWC